MTRWVIDTDGLGGCAVCDDSAGRIVRVSEPMPRRECERLIDRLRARDARRLAESRRAAGVRLAAGRWRQSVS